VSFGWTGDALADGTPTPGAHDGMAALSGTIRNCAGGPTPWGSWISCEETLEQRARRTT
jgi:secreted PhoX family phosphatase